MTFRNIIVDKSGMVTTLTINRQNKLNAMDSETRLEMICALKELKSDSNSRGLILTGAGDRAFSAGQDLAEAKDFRGESAEGWTKQ